MEVVLDPVSVSLSTDACVVVTVTVLDTWVIWAPGGIGEEEDAENEVPVKTLGAELNKLLIEKSLVGSVYIQVLGTITDTG